MKKLPRPPDGRSHLEIVPLMGQQRVEDMVFESSHPPRPPRSGLGEPYFASKYVPRHSCAASMFSNLNGTD